MNKATSPSSRREFIKTTGRIAAASAFAGMGIPCVHAAGNETLQLALIGCGGRGTGAVANAMSVNNNPVKLVAMADVFASRLNESCDALSRDHLDKMDLPPERKFIGFDAYQHAMDCLKPGDIAILTTPLAFRWVHYHIDRLCWMKNAWPVKCQALGGRHYRRTREGRLLVDQNFDSYSVEYTFADGAKMYMDGRCVPGCNDIYSTSAHGGKGMAVVTATGDDGPCSIHTGQNPRRDNAIWTSKVNRAEISSYENEWTDLVAAIRNDQPYNEVARGVQASIVSSMGRLAAHTGREITYDEMLNHPDEYAPDADKFTMDSPPPLVSAADGTYPIPMPGISTHHEYAAS